jgi:Zn-dependent peptidase ImmA (M78 family)
VNAIVYDNLLSEIEGQAIEVHEKKMSPRIKGLYGNNVIWINKNIPTTAEKGCILAEELGHHHTSTGNILDQRLLENRKQENRARNWAYEKLVPMTSFIDAHKQGIRNRHELAEFLEVTEDFLDLAIKRYKEKYGLMVQIGKCTICFEPLGVLELFE